VIKIPTEIKYEKLEYWSEKIPSCRRFPNNFFRTCQGFEPVVNYLNYVYDLGLYAPTHRHIRENRAKLMRAFNDIVPLPDNIENLLEGGKHQKRGPGGI